LPASTGDAGRRWGLTPLRRPWGTAVRAGSGRGSANKPGLGGGSWLLARGPVISLRAHRGDEIGGDLVASMSSGLDLQGRFLLLASCHPWTGLGGWFWRWRISEPPLPRVFLVLFLSYLPAGRGGEGQREGSRGKVVFLFFCAVLGPVCCSGVCHADSRVASSSSPPSTLASSRPWLVRGS
jgi:hypothetical protein